MGHQACETFAETTEITNDPLMRVGGMLEAGRLARGAVTEEIREAAEPVGSEWIADDAQLRAACESRGVDIP